MTTEAAPAAATDNSAPATATSTNTTTAAPAAGGAQPNTDAKGAAEPDIIAATAAALKEKGVENFLGDAAKKTSEGDKPDDGTVGDDKSADSADAQPEDLSTLTLPEGVTVNEELFSEAKQFMQDKGLTKEVAEGLLNLHTKNMEAISADLTKKVEDRQTEVWIDLQNKWREQAKNDPDIGGDKFDETQAIVSKVISEFSRDEARMQQLMTITGIGNNPDFLHMMRTAFKSVLEPKPKGGGPTAAPKSVASTMYPSMNQAT